MKLMQESDAWEGVPACRQNRTNHLEFEVECLVWSLTYYVPVSGSGFDAEGWPLSVSSSHVNCLCCVDSARMVQC